VVNSFCTILSGCQFVQPEPESVNDKSQNAFFFQAHILSGATK
jgi:hypothetical protein